MGRAPALNKGFTDKYIQSLKPKDKQYCIREGRGFAIRVSTTGFKTWLYIYTANKKEHNWNLGNYPSTSLAQAREKYQIAYNKVQQGIPLAEELQPTEQVPAGAESFLHFSKLYMQFAEQQHCKSYVRTSTGCLNNDLLPYLQDYPITAITRRMCITVLERVQQRSPGMTASVHRVLSGILNYAMQRDYIDSNPATRLAQVLPSLKANPRQRILTDAEIKHVWASAGDTRTARALRVILITAQRPGEVAGMHRSEIQGNVWTIPKERAEKGRGDHMVLLTQTALDIIGDSEGLIFDVQRNSISQMVEATQNYYGLPRWTPHDLRRTARTIMARIGIIDEHAEAVIAHCKQGIKKVYNLYEYWPEKQAALLKYEQELLRIIA